MDIFDLQDLLEPEVDDVAPEEQEADVIESKIEEEEI
jgi:hypothetical protein